MIFISEDKLSITTLSLNKVSLLTEKVSLIVIIAVIKIANKDKINVILELSFLNTPKTSKNIIESEIKISGNTKFKLGFIDEAVKNYKKAIKFNKKNFPAYFNLAHVYSEEKKFDDLKKVLQDVLKFDENNTTALNDLGYLNLILGNVDEGRKLFEKVINIDAVSYTHLRAHET